MDAYRYRNTTCITRRSELGNPHNCIDARRTSSISINIRDLTLDDRSIQESLVRHPQPLFRLVLFAFSFLPRCSNCLEGRRRDGIIDDSYTRRVMSRSDQALTETKRHARNIKSLASPIIPDSEAVCLRLE